MHVEGEHIRSEETDLSASSWSSLLASSTRRLTSWQSNESKA